MNKIYITGIISLISYIAFSQAESATEEYQMAAYKQEIEADFLSSYYHQEGNNGAVTGGIGTEQLTDVSNLLTINIPLNEENAINILAAADYYTSASTDAIDNNVSSASSKDIRTFSTLSYSKLNRKASETYNVRAGFSVEYDYTSVNGGLSYSKEWNEGNSSITVAGQAFIDQWEIIFPKELRGSVSLPTNKRQSYNGQFFFSQILSQRLQVGLSAEIIHMNGLLSTPFHRIYFADTNAIDIERLPSTRLKIPLGIRLNYYAFENLVIRTHYRYYSDDFGIKAHSIELETPLQLGNSWTISPFYRYHTQTASDYFGAYETHLSSETFYTSDYDLSALQNHKVGLGIQYYPVDGILTSKAIEEKRSGIKKTVRLKYIALRGASYQRSTGLNAFFTSLNIGLSIN